MGQYGHWGWGFSSPGIGGSGISTNARKTSSTMRIFALLSFVATSAVVDGYDVPSLTYKNYEELTEGKTVFIKYVVNRREIHFSEGVIVFQANNRVPHPLSFDLIDSSHRGVHIVKSW